MLAKLLILSVFSIVLAEKVRYDDFALYKVNPENEEHLEFLKDLYKSDDGLDFWLAPSKIGQFVSVVSPPEKREEFEHALKKRNIFSELMLENIQEAFDAQVQFSRRKRDASQMHWTNYQALEDINEWFRHLAQAHSDIVSLINIGTTFQGRNITGIKISRSTTNRAFVLEGGQVAADWLSPTVLTYIVDQLVKGEDPEALRATQDFEWHIFPVLNPDGHEYTQIRERLWVKNRRPITIATTGVDLTKNWNSQWGGKHCEETFMSEDHKIRGLVSSVEGPGHPPRLSGGSHDPSANNYIGIGPFTEVETRSLSTYIEHIGQNLRGFLSFRSFGQRLVIPFAHTTAPMHNYNEMVTIGRRAMGSLAVKYNTQYIVGTSKDVLDGATGHVTDWVKYRYNPPIAATYYLRDEGDWGYTLPVAQVLPSCEETYDSLMAILREARFINVI